MVFTGPLDLVEGVESILQGVLMPIQVEVYCMVQHDWQVVGGDIEVVTIPFAEDRVVLDG